jgi:TetR/AcrR family transcriptional regulator, copper-responsive repressor
MAVKYFIVINMEKEQKLPKRLGRPRNFDRDKVLNAAMLQFWQHGFEATSINDLAAAMNLNPPSIYGAFGDKKSLFEHAIRNYEEGAGCFAARALIEEKDPRRAVERLLMEAADNLTRKDHPPGCMVVLSALNCTNASADVHNSLMHRRQQSTAMISSRVDEAHKSGSLQGSIDSNALASLIVTVFHGLSIRARDGATREELEAVVQQAMRLWTV